jgi:hypothetical protein
MEKDERGLAWHAVMRKTVHLSWVVWRTMVLPGSRLLDDRECSSRLQIRSQTIIIGIVARRQNTVIGPTDVLVS